MAVTIEVFNKRYTINEKRWTGPDSETIELLTIFQETGSDPYPDLSIAVQVVDMYGGKIIDRGIFPKYDLQEIY